MSPTDNWPAAAGATLDERSYLCQNWRGDVVAVFSREGLLVNQVRYDPHGMPFVIPSIDFNGDGVYDLIDYFIWFDAYDYESTNPTGPRRRWADVNFDDTVDLLDFFAFQSEVDTAVELGRGKLGYPSGRAHGHVRRGYAGAELAAELVTGAPGTYHMRHRVYQADEGRWTRRDPIGYHDGMNLYEYVGSGPVGRIDPSGLMYLPCNSGACGGGGGPPSANSNPSPHPGAEVLTQTTNRTAACARWAAEFCRKLGSAGAAGWVCNSRCVAAAAAACRNGGNEQESQRAGVDAFRKCIELFPAEIYPDWYDWDPESLLRRLWFNQYDDDVSRFSEWSDGRMLWEATWTCGLVGAPATLACRHVWMLSCRVGAGFGRVGFRIPNHTWNYREWWWQN